jgi:hypothetical protein
VEQVRWPVLEGLWGTGLLVRPKTEPVAYVVLLPDAEQTPEQLLGLSPGIPAAAQVARRLAENGFELPKFADKCRIGQPFLFVAFIDAAMLHNSK